VRELYHRLKEADYHPWLDKEDLLPGQDWRHEIEKIIHDPYNIVVVCLSCNSVTKRGVVQQEIKWALDVLDQTPEGTIYLIPARLEYCQVPGRLLELHWVNLFEPDGFDKLKQALDFEIGRRQPLRQPFEPELVLILAGEFLMGSDPEKDKDTIGNEQPQRKLHLPDYNIAKTPVTNAQYEVFVEAAGHEPPEPWGAKKSSQGREDHPVCRVNWYDAVAYCQWLTEVSGKVYRLPSEAEWEKAARGTDGRIYPWGDKWDVERCNTWEGGKNDTTPVGVYPQGASPYGLLDMAGNIWEWTRSLARKYPYDPTDGRESPKASGDVQRVARGGAWSRDRVCARCARRLWGNPNDKRHMIGFRVVVSPHLY
jgi:formylglycine-generating enzyme required for sulfatase activity